MQITISTAANGDYSDPTLIRIVRAPNGVSRAAAYGGTALPVGEADNEHEAREFAEQIGVQRRQVIHPTDMLNLPIVLYIPSPIEGTLKCQPDGGGVNHHRETLIFSCTMDEQIHTDRIDARARLAGVEEIDVLTGVRLSASLTGSLRGLQRTSSGQQGRSIDDRIWYDRTMEFAASEASSQHFGTDGVDRPLQVGSVAPVSNVSTRAQK